MGLSSLKGKSGYLGIDKRDVVGSTGGAGNISVRKFYLERLRGNLTPIPPGGITTLFSDDFSDGTLDKWTVINGSEPSVWYVGSAVRDSNGGTGNEGGSLVTIPSGSTNSAFISNNSTNNYYDSNSDCHMYFDFTIPATAISLTLTFDWLCYGERSSGVGSYDYGYIMLCDPSSFTPNAGTEYGSSGTGYERIVGSNTADNEDRGKFTGDGTSARSSNTSKNTFVHENITINGTEITSGTLWSPGDDRRLVFSWASDSSLVDNPSFSIANVILKFE
jgi:hypothetical protein